MSTPPRAPFWATSQERLQMFKKIAAVFAAVAVLVLGVSLPAQGAVGPTNPKVTAVTDTSVTVTWSAVSGATGYKVSRDAAGGESRPVVDHRSGQDDESHVPVPEVRRATTRSPCRRSPTAPCRR